MQKIRKVLVASAKLPAPFPSNTEISDDPVLVTARSRWPSAFKSPIPTEFGVLPAPNRRGEAKTPAPFPSKSETLSVLLLAVTWLVPAALVLGPAQPHRALLDGVRASAGMRLQICVSAVTLAAVQCAWSYSTVSVMLKSGTTETWRIGAEYRILTVFKINQRIYRKHRG